MKPGSAYVLVIVVAAATLTACGSSTPTAAGPSGGSSQPSYAAPSTPDGMPSIRLSPFPEPSIDPNDPTVAQCRKDLVAATDASHQFFVQFGYYAENLAALVKKGLLKAVPTDVSYGYIQADTEPTILGKVTGC